MFSCITMIRLLQQLSHHPHTSITKLLHNNHNQTQIVNQTFIHHIVKVKVVHDNSTRNTYQGITRTRIVEL